MTQFQANQLYTLAVFVVGVAGLVMFLRDLQGKGK